MVDMPKIASVGTAVPHYDLSQDTVQQFAKEMFGEAFRDIDRLLAVFHNANIHKRHLSVPITWFEKSHSFQEKNDTYIQVSCELGAQAVNTCLRQAGLTPQDVDHLIFVSSTGLATPSIDARLANQLHMSSHLKRTPIWGLGCAGGAVGLSRAYEYAKAYPQSRVVMVALELCGLTFQRHDLSKSNLIAASLFADGAAAALVTGDEGSLERMDGPRIKDTMSTLWPQTEDVMGWDVGDDGLRVIFSKDIPTIVKTHIRPNLTDFLAREDLTLDDITHYVTHPGGMKVIQAYEDALNLSPDATTPARRILSEYGNMSSASVLFVLEEVMPLAEKGEYGVMTALGPGFSSEHVLLQW